MALTNLQKTVLEKARASGGGSMGVSLSDEACTFLIATIAHDLGAIGRFPEFKNSSADFFGVEPENASIPTSVGVYALFERLVSISPNADTYFQCLAALHRTRLKYARILEQQPIPTMDQVGPRSLLQFGMMRPHALATFLLWRKWIFDIDNRAAQETGYLFEPIIAHSIGGVPFSAKKSPIRRSKDKTKGRQVDCISEKRAYEFKIRITIAASGQGRWAEELEYPVDCRTSGYTPVLIVLDPTENPKLHELVEAFEKEHGEVHVGPNAWTHLEAAAGEAMGLFLEKYVRRPIQLVLEGCPPDLPELTLSMSDAFFDVVIGGDRYSFPRAAADDFAEDDKLPEDIEEETPGP